MPRTVLLILLILLLVGVIPAWQSPNLGPYPAGGLGLVVVILLILMLMGIL